MAELSPAGKLDATVTSAPLTAASAGYPVDTANEQFVFPQLVSENLHATLSDVEVNRFTTAGALASSTGAFTFAGATDTVKDAVQTAIVLPNGQALAIGIHIPGGETTANDANAVFAFARVNPDGTLDSTFGTGGAALTTVNDASGGGFFALLPQSDGTVIAVGAAIDGDALELARFNL